MLFENNVSVYRFYAEPSQAQNGAVYGTSRGPSREIVVLSNGPTHDAIIRPPALSSSHDVPVLLNRRCCRSSSAEPDHRRVRLNSMHRRTEKYLVDDNFTPSSSTVIVGDFEVHGTRSNFVERCYIIIIIIVVSICNAYTNTL